MVGCGFQLLIAVTHTCHFVNVCYTSRLIDLPADHVTASYQDHMVCDEIVNCTF